MSETEALYTIPEPTPEQKMQALVREIAHVTEQMKVVYVQIMHWKERARAAENTLERLQQASGRTQVKTGTPSQPRVSDGLHWAPETLDQLL